MATSDKQQTPFRRHFAELNLSVHMHAEPLRRCAALIALSTLISACFASEALYDWAFNLPLWTGPFREAILFLADAWHGAMTAIGVAEVRIALGDLLRAFKAL